MSNRVPLLRPDSALIGLTLALLSCPGRAQTPPNLKIYRDTLGIGHVYADTNVATFYGIGRLHARDKPLLTMVGLTWGAGSLAKTLGPIPLTPPPPWLPGGWADLFVHRDRKVRAFKVPERAQEIFASYCNGPPVRIRNSAP